MEEKNEQKKEEKKEEYVPYNSPYNLIDIDRLPEIGSFEFARAIHTLFNNIITYSDKNTSSITADFVKERVQFKTAFEDIIHKFKKPVVIGNVLMYTVLRTMYNNTQEKEGTDHSLFMIDEFKSFMLHTDWLLDGFCDKFIVMEEDAHSKPMVVYYNTNV